MPRALSATVRHEIITLHRQGLSLAQIAAQLRLPSGSVRRIWRHYRTDPSRPLDPDYSRWGRTPAPRAQAHVHAACQMKREHPTWGAGLIRVKLIKQTGDRAVPAVRTLQLAFVQAGVNRPRRPRPQPRLPTAPRATEAHQVWEVDAKERIPLAGGQRVSWLAFTDEASGPCWPPSFPPQGHWEKVPAAEIQAMFRRAFTRWGLPQAIRVDNGYPWGTPRDLPTELALWLIGLGLEVIWNPPAQPRENPKVERCQGLADAWAEPHACADLAQLNAHLDWAGEIQRQDYPSIHGTPRIDKFPRLKNPRRAYEPSQEPGLWQLARVDQWLSQGVWVRRVGKTGVLSMYGHRHSLGRTYRGQEVVVRFDPLQRSWVVADPRGEALAQFPAWELSQDRILSLAVGRKRSQRQKS